MTDSSRNAPAEWVEEASSLIRALLDHATHRASCGVVLAGSDCGSYGNPWCHLDALRAKAALLLGEGDRVARARDQVADPYRAAAGQRALPKGGHP